MSLFNGARAGASWSYTAMETGPSFIRATINRNSDMVMGRSEHDPIIFGDNTNLCNENYFRADVSMT